MLPASPRECRTKTIATHSHKCFWRRPCVAHVGLPRNVCDANTFGCMCRYVDVLNEQMSECRYDQMRHADVMYITNVVCSLLLCAKRGKCHDCPSQRECSTLAPRLCESREDTPLLFISHLSVVRHRARISNTKDMMGWPNRGQGVGFAVMGVVVTRGKLGGVFLKLGGPWSAQNRHKWVSV